MFKLYRFSPIKTKPGLIEAVNYVALKTTELCLKNTGQHYRIGPLTIFAHYSDEFEYLKKIALEMGEQFEEHNGPFVNLRKSIKLPNNELRQLRIRHADPYRPQVGCNDFLVSDYEEFKEKYLESNSKHLRLIKRPEYDMIELFDPDFDVLAYVVSN